jgi:hypothetical protein
MALYVACIAAIITTLLLAFSLLYEEMPFMVNSSPLWTQIF